MLEKIRKRIHATNHDRESGSDVVTTLFLIPIFVALLFGIIDISTYFQTKTQVQNVTRDGARLVALMGGSSETIPLNIQKFGGSGQNVTKYVYDRLVSNGECSLSGCKTLPTVTCGPNVANQLTQDAYCQVSYSYRGVSGAIISILGFDQIINQTINSKETFKVETAW